jgi:acyl-CoA synthetase (AMP-forming)/AMP-acid ligase II
MIYYTMNVADIFEDISDVVPSRLAVTLSDGSSYTYGEMDIRANRCGHMLEGLGVARGDRVAVLARNRIEWLDVLLGCLKIGALVANVDYRYTASELQSLLADCDARVVVVEPEFAASVAKFLPHLQRTPCVLVLNDELSGVGEGMLSYAEMWTSAEPARNFAPRRGDDGYLLYTSGTTGMPKGVLWTQHELSVGALSGGDESETLVMDPFDIRPRAEVPAATTLVSAPLMSGSGQWAVLRTWVAAATAVVWTGQCLDAERFWDTVERFAVSVTSVVGDAMAIPLVEALGRHPGRWGLCSLRAFESGGAVLSPHVRAALRTWLPAVTVIDRYGGSESGTIGTLVDPGDGTPPAFEVRSGVRVVRHDMTEASIGESGLLAASGAIARGYWRDERKTSEVFRTDQTGRRWAVFGDNAIRNADGTVSLLGRESLVVNTGGEQVFPDEVESVLKRHPAVLDAVVVGADDPTLGEHVAAVVALRAAQEIDLTMLQDHSRRYLVGYKIPRSLIIVDELRRSPAGNADYKWAKQMVSAAGSFA